MIEAAREDSGAGCACQGDIVERPAMLFRFGDYPEKRWSLTEVEFGEANAGLESVPIGLDPVEKQHYEGRSSALDGRTGEVVGLWVRDGELWGTARLPRWAHDAARDAGLKLSAVFDPGSRRLRKVDLVGRPHVKDAAILFADAAGEDPARSPLMRGYLGHVGDVLREMAGADPKDRCPITVDFYARCTGRSPVASEVVEFCDRLDAELAVNFPPAIAFDDRPPTDQETRMSTAAAEREARRKENQDWARAYQGQPPEAAEQTPVAFDDDALSESTRAWARSRNPAPTPPAPPAANPLANPLAGLLGPQLPQAPEPLVGFTEESLAAALAAPGLRLRERAARELASMAPTTSAVRRGLGQPPVFDNITAEWIARERAVLRAIVEGRVGEDGSVDRDAIDLEAARDQVWAWWSMGLGVAALVALAGDAIHHYNGVAARLSGMLAVENEFAYYNLRGATARALEFTRDRAKCLARSAALRAAIEALPGALASRLGPIVEGIGGAEKLVVKLREAGVPAGNFPGPDRQLEGLMKEMQEAGDRMRSLRAPEGEEDGDLFATASARHGELVVAYQEREALVRRRAMEAIRSGVAAALAGNPVDVANLQAAAKRTPEAFPPSLADQLDSAALESVLEAGAGFAWCL